MGVDGLDLVTRRGLAVEIELQHLVFGKAGFCQKLRTQPSRGASETDEITLRVLVQAPPGVAIDAFAVMAVQGREG